MRTTAALDTVDGRLTGAAEWLWYVVAAVSYILAGIWHKWLLNWLARADLAGGGDLPRSADGDLAACPLVDRLIASRLIGRR